MWRNYQFSCIRVYEFGVTIPPVKSLQAVKHTKIYISNSISLAANWAVSAS